MIDNIIMGFSQLGWIDYVLVLAGAMAGLIFGCIPGLSGSTALTLAIPITLTLGPVSAFAVFMGIFVGGCSGGCISAILVGIPGTPSSLTTVFDGHTMAKNGQPGKALGTAIFFSFLGTLVSLVFLFALTEPIARIAVKLGPVELFSIILLSLSLISVLAGDDPIKGWIVALVGVFLGMVGISKVDGATRLTLGIAKLTSGFNQTPALLGIFVVGSLFSASLAHKSNSAEVTMDYHIRGLGFKLSDVKDQAVNIIRSALVGVGIGILPGIGGVTSNLVSYTLAKTFSKTPEKFGTGIIDGIIAPETANNASIGGAMIPLLALGIPGDGFTALLLGSFELHGFISGPTLLVNNAEFVYAIFAALLLSCIFTVVVEYFGLPLLVKTLKVPINVLMPVIMVLVMVGCFCVNNRTFECWVLLFFAFITFIFKQFKFSTTPIVLGFVLGGSAETYFRRGMMMAKDDISTFFTNPVSCTFIILAIVCSVVLMRQNKRSEAKLRQLAAESESEVDVEIDDD